MWNSTLQQFLLKCWNRTVHKWRHAIRAYQKMTLVHFTILHEWKWKIEWSFLWAQPSHSSKNFLLVGIEAFNKETSIKDVQFFFGDFQSLFSPCPIFEKMFAKIHENRENGENIFFKISDATYYRNLFIFWKSRPIHKFGRLLWTFPNGFHLLFDICDPFSPQFYLCQQRFTHT